MSGQTPEQLNSPIKVSERTHAQIKLGAAVLGTTMREFIDRAVTEFLAEGRDMAEANYAAIVAGEPIPYPADAYAEEISRRRQT